MNGAPRRTGLALLGVGLCLALAVATLRAREARAPESAGTERLLYLQSGQVADRVMLTFDALAADLYWIRAIQHYGRDVIAARRGRPRSDAFALLQPMLDLTTTLDPHFSIAYRFGSIFLAISPPEGPGRPDQAIALLEKGLRADPDRWQYAYDVAFVHYWNTGDFVEAARWFERAADMPDAPAWIRPFAALALAQGGRREDARAMLTRLLESPEEYMRNAADRGLKQLKALDDIDALEQAVEQFRTEQGRYPARFQEMFGGQVPLDPTNVPYALDPETHAVTLGSESRLAPLPATMGSK